MRGNLVWCFILFGTYNFPEPPVGRTLARHVGLKADLHFEQAMFRHPSIVKHYTSLIGRYRLSE